MQENEVHRLQDFITGIFYRTYLMSCRKNRPSNPALLEFECTGAGL
ncbi:hypothetical protein JOC78_001029 [Bacillus ectoiniformans]|nr:hypothetical protein [Bacillus ectoiniformans]